MKVSMPYFQGIKPIVAGDKLGAYEAQLAENCRLWNGSLRPWLNYLEDDDLESRGIVKAIMLYESSYWLEWTAEVDVIEAPIAGDVYGKIFWTGDGVPKKADRTLITTGTGKYPRGSYPLAVPTPKPALSAAASSPPAGTGDDRYVNYVWTVVTDWGEESYISPASSNVTAKDGQLVNLTGITMIWQTAIAYTLANSVYPVASEGGTYLYKCVQAGTSGASEPSWNATIGGYTYDGTVVWQCFANNLEYKRVYRLEVGNEYATYQYLTQIGIATTSYADSTDAADLSNSCPTLSIASGGSAEADYDPPDDSLQGLCYLGNGISLAFKGKDIYPTIPYKMWAFPVEYSQTVPENVVSITPIGLGAAIVCTTAQAYILQGTNPGSITIDKIPFTRPNLSKRGAVAYNNGTVYPASDGLRYVNSTTNTLITAGHYDTEKWADVYPSTMHGAIHDNKYFGFYSSGSNQGCFVFDLKTQKEITSLDFYCFATWVDPQNDKLYFIRSTPMAGFSETWTNPDAASASGKATQYDLDGGAGVMASIVQPDYPRNAILTLTGGNVTVISITLAGTNSEGEADTETFTFSSFDTGTATGNVAWAELDSVTINSVTGSSGDTLDLGYGKKFGLANSIDSESDVFKVNENNDDSDVDDLTISTTYNTVTFETDPDAANDYQLWYNAEIS